VACEAFLFTIPLADEETFADFRVVATRFADIRRAIRKGIERKFGFGEGKPEVTKKFCYYASPSN
jgi:hypothetical protein